MKDTISSLLNLPDVRVIETEQLGTELHITVESTLEGTECRKCGRTITTSHGFDDERVLRHLSCFGLHTFIHIRPRRYECIRCPGNPTTTQRLSWYSGQSPHTKAYEDYILLLLINSTVCDVAIKEGIGYEAVMGIVKRRVDAKVNWKRIECLELIGVDEIALRKGHKDYVAIITGRSGGRTLILAVLGDREKDTVKNFLLSIPKRLRKQVRAVCTDMYEGFVNAAKEVFSKRTKLVVDRFHVAKLYRGAVDELRKTELRRLKKELPAKEYEKFKGAMWALRKNIVNRTEEDERILRDLFVHSPLLKLAYYLSGLLTDIFNNACSKRSARCQLKGWVALVEGSGLSCFDTFLGTLNKRMEEILNYFVDRDSSGFVEGLNNKIKVIKRRCYGIVNVAHLFQRIHLDLSGYDAVREQAFIS